MKTYREFRPTPHDIAGLSLPEQQDWFVAPVIRTRDSGPLEQSNFRVMEKMLEEVDKDGNDHEVHRFGHWGPGWFEIILIRPDTSAVKIAQDSENALAYYPILSDEDYSELKLEEKQSYWKVMQLEERIELCKRANVSIFAARRDEVPGDVLQYIEVQE